MKKTLHILLVFAFALCGIRANAEVTAADTYGRYTFTATVTVTAAGESAGLADQLKAMASGEVEICMSSQPGYFDLDIKGLLGSTAVQHAGFNSNMKQMQVASPNCDGYLLEDLKLCVGDANGMYMGWNMNYAYNETTRTFTIPAFSIVRPTTWMLDEAGTVMATVTNAKLTYAGAGETTAYTDLSGEWRFVPDPSVSWATMMGSTLPDTYTLALTSTDATNSTYAVKLGIEGIGEAELTGTFNGLTLEITGSDIVMGEHALGDLYDSESTNLLLRYTVQNANSFEMTNGFIVKSGSSMVQYYNMGTITNLVVGETYDFVGTYTVTCGRITNKTITDDGGQYPAQGTSFTFTVEEVMGQLVVTEWMGMKVSENGESTATALGNRLSIDQGKAYRLAGYSADFSKIEYDVLGGPNPYSSNPLGEPVVVTANEDGTFSITDFTMMRVSRVFNEDYSEFTQTPNLSHFNFYQQCTITKAGADGIGTAKAAKPRQAVYSISGQRVSKPTRGLYIINGKKTTK